MSLAGKLKEVFEQHKGEKQLYLIVGINTIKAESKLDATEAFRKAIKEVDESIRIVEI